MPNRIGGVLYFDVDGERFAVRGNVTYSIGDNEKESVVGQGQGADKYHGYKENPMAPFIQMDVTDLQGTEVNTLQNARGVKCTLGLGNGNVLTLTNATQINQIEVDAIEGQMTIRFEGSQAYID